jgi:Matrixin
MGIADFSRSRGARSGNKGMSNMDTEHDFETSPAILFLVQFRRLERLGDDRSVRIWTTVSLSRKVDQLKYELDTRDLTGADLIDASAKVIVAALLEKIRKSLPPPAPTSIRREVPDPESGRYSIVKAVGMFLLLIGLAHGSMACSGAIPLADSYHVVVSPKFTADEQAEVVAAAESWSPVTKLDVTVGTPGGQEHEIDIAPGTLAEGADGDTYGLTVRSPSSDSARTTLDTGKIAYGQNPYDPTAQKLQTVAAHELGHAMGLVHTAAGSLMYFDADLAPMLPTAADLAQWQSLR